MPILDEYIPRTELARQLGVSDRTIARYETEPDGLPSLMVGGRKLYPTAAVKAWLERRIHYPNARPTATLGRFNGGKRYGR